MCEQVWHLTNFISTDYQDIAELIRKMVFNVCPPYNLVWTISKADTISCKDMYYALLKCLAVSVGWFKCTWVNYIPPTLALFCSRLF